MTTELKKYLYKLVPKEDEIKIIEDVVDAGSLEEAVFMIDNNFCIAMFQEFDIRELKK
jgi:hypothetical protein